MIRVAAVVFMVLFGADEADSKPLGANGIGQVPAAQLGVVVPQEQFLLVMPCSAGAAPCRESADVFQKCKDVLVGIFLVATLALSLACVLLIEAWGLRKIWHIVSAPLNIRLERCESVASAKTKARPLS